MELRSDLEDRHRFQTNREPEHVTQDIAEAMQLSLDFLQSITDLDGDFERLVLPCLDLTNCITYEMDTSELGHPEAVSTIKRLCHFQSERMHQLRERRTQCIYKQSKSEEDRRSPNCKQTGQFAQKQVTGHPHQQMDTNQGRTG